MREMGSRGIENRDDTRENQTTISNGTRICICGLLCGGEYSRLVAAVSH